MNEQPLLTHIIVGRNDNYLGNFKHRLELAVNYTCNSVAASGNVDNYELLVVDWNSPSPLRMALNLNENARQCTSFLEVPPEMVQQHKPSDANLDMATALNVGIRRALGRMVMVAAADVLFPIASMRSLFYALSGENLWGVNIDRCYLGVERFPIPWQASERLTIENVERYLLLHQTGLSFEHRAPGVSGGEGAQIFSKRMLFDIQGFDESYIYWGGQDSEIVWRINQQYPMLKLLHMGVFCYDLSQRPVLRAATHKKTNAITPSVEMVVNSSSWGLNSVIIERKQAIECHCFSNEPVCKISPYDTRDDNRANEGSLLLKIGCIWDCLLRNKLFLKMALVLFSYRFVFNKKQNNRIKRKIYTLFCFFAFKSLVVKWLTISQEKNQEWFISEWFADKESLKKYFDCCALNKPLFLCCDTWDAQNASAFIAILATLGRQRPLRFLYCPRREYYIARAATLVDPTMEITGYDHWEDSSESAGFIAWVLMESGFKGHYHTLCGPAETIFERLRSGQFINEPYQCVYLDLDFLGINADECVPQLAPLLDSRSSIICKGARKDLQSWDSGLHALGFAPVGHLPGVCIFARDKAIG